MSPVGSDAGLSLVVFGFRKAGFDLVSDGIPRPPWFWQSKESQHPRPVDEQ